VFKRRILAVIKKQRDVNNFTLYRIVLLIVILVMNIFLHSIDPLKAVDHIFRDKSECTILASLLSTFTKQFQLPSIV